MEVDGGCDPVVRENLREKFYLLHLRRRSPPTDLSPPSWWILLEVGVPVESAPLGGISEVTPSTEIALSLPLEPLVEIQQVEEDVSVGPRSFSILMWEHFRNLRFRALSGGYFYGGGD